MSNIAQLFTNKFTLLTFLTWRKYLLIATTAFLVSYKVNGQQKNTDLVNDSILIECVESDNQAIQSIPDTTFYYHG